jgi:hypothetical protein
MRTFTTILLDIPAESLPAGVRDKLAKRLGGVFFALCTLVAVAPFRRPHVLARACWICSVAPNELPLLSMAIVVVSTAPSLLDDHVTTGDSISGAIALLTVLGLGVVARRTFRAGRSSSGPFRFDLDWSSDCRTFPTAITERTISSTSIVTALTPSDAPH